MIYNENKENITFEEFYEEFEKEYRNINFSDEGFKTLYKYYANLEDEDIYLDVVDMCNDWTEYDSIEDAEESENMENKKHLTTASSSVLIYNF